MKSIKLASILTAIIFATSASAQTSVLASKLSAPVAYNDTAIVGQTWTAPIFGGANGGAYIMCVVGQTNWSQNTSWTPTATGTYTYYIGLTAGAGVSTAGTVTDPNVSGNFVFAGPFLLTVNASAAPVIADPNQNQMDDMLETENQWFAVNQQYIGDFGLQDYFRGNQDALAQLIGITKSEDTNPTAYNLWDLLQKISARGLVYQEIANANPSDQYVQGLSATFNNAVTLLQSLIALPATVRS